MDRQATIKAQYLGWLLERIHAHTGELTHYVYMLQRLYNTKAIVLIEADNDRILNAVFNRRNFLTAYPLYTIDEVNEAIGPGNLLELGYYLADYTNDQIIREEPCYDGTTEIFWELIDNVGLTRYTERYMRSDPKHVAMVDYIIETLNERQYTPIGVGNWFRLKCPRDGIDMRKIDLLRQSWVYINEGQGSRWNYKR